MSYYLTAKRSHNLFALFTLLLASSFTFGQTPSRESVRTPWSTDLQPEWLQQLMPQATNFSDKEGEPPVYRAYSSNPDTGEQTLLGFVFFSADVPPQEKGYSAPIDMLIGLSVDGEITGIKVLDYHESFRYSRGDFAADSVFQAQFNAKPITDEFRILRDIDGLSAATMTSFGISRGARDAARRVATAYLGYKEGDAQERRWAANAREILEKMSWEEMQNSGMIKTLSMIMLIGTELELTVTYIGREVLGEFFIGEEAYKRAERDASIRLGGREMMLIAVGGTGAMQFRQNLMFLQQGDGPPRRVQVRRFVTAGNADAGAISGRANYAGALVLEDDFDVTQPFTILYQPQGSPEPFGIEYQLGGIGLDLARGLPILSEQDIEDARIANAGFLVRLWYAPPWGVTPWVDVMLLIGLLALAMSAFTRKNENLRWITLTLTLGYLGFFKSGFLSISHITGLLSQGPEVLLTNLPMLIMAVFTLISTILWGRIFCSSLCPFGAVQDYIARFTPKAWRIKVPQAIHDKALYIKYGFLALIIVTALINNQRSIFQYFEPFGTLFFFSSSVLLWAILIAILIGCVLVERFYCRYVCPLGAALGVVALVSPWRIERVPQCRVCKVCEHACPTGAIRKEAIDFKECVRCDVCESKLITKAGSCRHSMEDIAKRQRDKSRIHVINAG